MKKICFLLLFLGSMGFFSSKVEARLDPHSHAMLSRPRLAKHIKVECYLVNREQLAQLFNAEDYAVIQLSNEELCNQEVYLLVRCKNKGIYMLFGDLHCFIPNREHPIVVDIDQLDAHMQSFHDCVFYIGKGFLEENTKKPQIRYKWDCMYAL